MHVEISDPGPCGAWGATCDRPWPGGDAQGGRAQGAGTGHRHRRIARGRNTRPGAPEQSRTPVATRIRIRTPISSAGAGIAQRVRAIFAAHVTSPTVVQAHRGRSTAASEHRGGDDTAACVSRGTQSRGLELSRHLVPPCDLWAYGARGDMVFVTFCNLGWPERGAKPGILAGMLACKARYAWWYACHSQPTILQVCPSLRPHPSFLDQSTAMTYPTGPIVGPVDSDDLSH